MKKRAKIITTIASLCLAVALMAFGVYAMTQATIAVTTQINFTVTDVFVDVTAKEYISNDADPSDLTDADVVGYVAAANETPAVVPTYTATTYTTESGVTSPAQPGVATYALEAWTPTVVALDSTHTVATWIITIVNQSTTNSITVSSSADIFTVISGTYRTATYKNGTGAETAYFTETAATADRAAQTLASQTVAPNTTFVITLQVVVSDYSKKITTTNALSGTLYIANVTNAQS